MNRKNKFLYRIKSFINFRNNNGNNNSHKYYEHLLDYEYSFYIEEYFHDLLYIERKRAERSLKSFLLMLVDINGLLDGNEIGENEKSGLAYALSSCKRETDIAGWYKYNSMVGVIFTETKELNQDQLRKKIYNNLNNILDPNTVKRIKISFHVFPEKTDSKKINIYKPDPKLYSENQKRNYFKKSSVFFKRYIDILLSVIFVAIFSPLFLAIPVLIKLSSNGPVLFKQKRTGRFGKEFNFLKFRTMHINNDDTIHKKYIENLICDKENGNGSKKNNGNGSIYKMANDPRVTTIGKILRKSSMDELPQFFNVLKGDMSIVGPRPPIPYEIKHYEMWHRRRIRRVKPGITGVWQVEGRSRTTFDEMVRMDIRYMREWDLLLDMKILLKTPFAIVSGKGAS
jgi:lipopolysaccharide/colanic/teichoic acid biosynthesis glycosyltransferase